MSTSDFYKTVQNHVKLEHNITVVETLEDFSIEEVENGIITLWVNWSIGYLNCKNCIEYLQDKKYQGHIYIINTDLIQADFQKRILKSQINGWGELFVVKNGQVTERFLGKENSIAFKAYIDKHMNS